MNIIISFMIGNLSGALFGIMLMCLVTITKGGDE